MKNEIWPNIVDVFKHKRQTCGGKKLTNLTRKEYMFETYKK